jgi:integrase/recombinase XerD
MLDTLAMEVAERPGPDVLRLKALVELLYGSGLRATELVSLPRNAIRPPIPHAVVVGKGGKERLVPVSPAALEAVAAHLRAVPAASRFLFPSGRGHLSRVRLFQLLRALAAAAGLDPSRVSPHVLRHAFATHMLANGADLRVLQTLLGHADIATTEIYTHVDAGRLVETVARLHPLADGPA